MTNSEEKAAYALKSFPKLKEHFTNFICNPEHKLQNIGGVIVTPSDQSNLRLQALGKEIEVRFSIVFLEECNFLGQVTAYLIKNPDASFVSEIPVFSMWFDGLGNIKTPEPTSTSFQHLNDNGSLAKFVISSLATLVGSGECQPLNNC